MTPAARIQAAIDLLAEIEALEAPADGLARGFFRKRRYIGAKDRRAVSALVYGVLRARARLDWWIARAAPAATGVRGRTLAHLALDERQSVEDLAALFDGGRYHPPALGPEERALAEALRGCALDHPEQPDRVRGELPEWLLPKLRETFGDDLEAELAALARQAPLDLRVNSLKADRAGAVAALAAEGIEAVATPLSPLGLRVRRRHTLPGLVAFRDGLVEVQDEGSQLVALLTDARPGMSVADFCAGAGGKTLALAAAMGDRGRLAMLDTDVRRLERAGPRLTRAGIAVAEPRALEGAEDPWLAGQAGVFDRVLVDAPCSGSGAWRRNPDARWRLTPERLEAYQRAQGEILTSAARLVAPGGRLVYATCSLLPEENGRQVARFRAAHPDFAPLPLAGIWADTVGGACPMADSELMLTPARHGTDGFYLAVLERRAGP
jgi:16S rRNA (cytosine967-C5)-methyltransferase